MWLKAYILLVGALLCLVIFWLQLRRDSGGSTRNDSVLLSSSSNSRTLIVMQDNRELTPDFDSAIYPTLNAVANYLYARTTNADFKYVSEFLNVSLLAESLRKEYAVRAELGSHNVPSSYHPRLRVLRGRSWAKLLFLWKIAPQYDRLLFIDSDVLFTDATRSVEVFFGDGHKQVVQGHARPSEAGLVFLSDAPWGPRLPCGGVFLVNTQRGGRKMLLDWWNIDFPKSAHKHSYDQMALRWVLGLPSLGLNHPDPFQPSPGWALTPSRVSTLLEKQFLDDSHSPEDGRPRWVRHYFHGKKGSHLREPRARERLAELHCDRACFAEAVAEIQRSRVVFDVLSIAEDMDLATAAGG
jgi:hypothetical protein